MNINKIALLIVTILSITCTAKSQTNSLTINDGIHLPKDSMVSSQLIKSLNEFLITAQKSNEENQLILPSAKAETYMLVDEFKNIGSIQKSNILFRPYLTNILAMGNEQYLIQLSYLGIKETTPYLRASFELIATKANDFFLFSSPLIRNTKDWKTIESGSCIFHYQDRINQKQVEAYSKTVSRFDSLLQSPIKITELYICDNLTDLLKAIGVDYKLDYNGYPENSTSAVANEKMVIVEGVRDLSFDQFDPHDLFHERVSAAMPEGQNHFMVCGCAYLYGGSWGISWEDIQKLFKTRMVYDKKTDWLKLYYEKYNFGESSEKHLLIPQFVNALIIQKVEKEQGFSAVMDLLASGDMVNEREHFFKVLEKVSGINEKNFNKKVGKLIDDSILKP